MSLSPPIHLNITQAHVTVGQCEFGIVGNYFIAVSGGSNVFNMALRQSGSHLYSYILLFY